VAGAIAPATFLFATFSLRLVTTVGLSGFDVVAAM